MSITLRSRRGAIGEGWHAVALRRALEALLGSRTLAAGRRLARSQAVQWIDVGPGTVRAEALDPDGELRRPQLGISAFSADERSAVLRVAARRHDLALRMSAGEYPEEFEADLAREEMSLLPHTTSDGTFHCTCMDWPGPCQHVSALLYLLVEAVDEDPLLLLTLRGLDLSDLAGARADADPGTGRGSEPPAPSEDDPAPEDDSAQEPDGEGTDPHSASFDPLIADPSLLVEGLGPEAARIIGEFYRTAPERDGET
ncbi:hypothetical protein [Brachybacterium phenoliresistens]|uniref:SWIM zinc finger family protein n=1 Tax=Brachybacterium phenoliresistens TaxID=396014 RepID=UPI0004BB2770|nr:hypothetical protein [Brachybacterium phenoliresistens]